MSPRQTHLIEEKNPMRREQGWFELVRLIFGGAIAGCLLLSYILLFTASRFLAYWLHWIIFLVDFLVFASVCPFVVRTIRWLER